VGFDGSGAFIGYLPTGHQGLVFQVEVAADGTFGGTPAPSAAGAVPRVAEAASGLTGSIASGQVSGTLDGASYSGAEDAAAGPDVGLAGYYASPALYSSSGATYTVVGPSGQTAVVVETAGTGDAATGSLGSTGQLTAQTAGGSSLSLTVNAQGAATTLTPAGAGAPVSFSGINANIASTTRLVNLSVRGPVGTGANLLIEGFVTSGTGTDQLVLRGVGPTLAEFAVPGPLAVPQLTLFSPQGTALDSDSGWGGGLALSQAFSRVGAFALPAGSADSALLEVLPVGAYTAQLAGTGGATGLGLIELYDDNPLPSSVRLANISARGAVGTGANILIAGFAISGNAPETVLIRGIGPSLAQFGLGGLLAAPQLTLFDSGGHVLDANAGWGSAPALSAAFAKVGAFTLPAGSADAALIENLPPGTYTVELSGAQGGTGLALVEVYEVR
jgi:hypothetical protein